MSVRRLRVALLHPDLRLGGSERVLVDAALAFQRAGHSVTVFAEHHDPARCFPETVDGTLDVRVLNGWGALIPAHLGQKLRAPCAFARMSWLAATAALGESFDLFFCDLISAPVPLLRGLGRAPVIFYCHFPDLLLSDHGSRLRRLYRAPLDWLEGATTARADRVLVNSRFTEQMFRRVFRKHGAVRLEVLHPCVEPARYAVRPMGASPITFLTLNRYERKKNVGLALDAIARLKLRLPSAVFAQVRLAVAGGYDERSAGARETFESLQAQARALGLEEQVSFHQSISESERKRLIEECRCLLYTPVDEHFGIGPLEAMAASRPVIAVNSGGPRETVVHDETGFLEEPTPEAFSAAMLRLIEHPEEAQRLGGAGRARVEERFSSSTFAAQLNRIALELVAARSARGVRA